MQTSSHILVVDDDQEIRRLLGRYLDGQGFRVTLAADRREFERVFPDSQIDLVVLDVMLPDGSGLEICRNLRGQRQYIPIILLTALKEEIDRIIGLEIGADDYLAKPFNPRELVARIRAVLRRGWEAPEPATGLGLAIAREIVVRCGGGIAIHNRDGGGLIQTVTLAPVPPAARAALLDQLTARLALLDQVG